MATRERIVLKGMDEEDTARDAGTAGSRAIDMATLNARCARNLMKRTMMIQRLT